MTGPDVPGTLDALSSEPDRTEEILVERLLAGTSDPLLRELLLTSALPRAFDADMLAALTGNDAADSGFARAFAGLAANSFVYERADGMLALHDSIRPTMLDRCRADMAGMASRVQRLLEYHQRQYRQARGTADALARVGPLMRQARSERWSAAADRVEDLLIRPAIEALHVAFMIKPDKGHGQLVETFVQLEDEARYRLCGLLVSAFAEEASELPAEAQATYRGWTACFAARLANDQQLWKEAERQLASVAEPEELDLKLASWIYTEQARYLNGQDRYDEALAALDRMIVIHDEHKVDRWNACVPWGRKAEIYQSLWDQDQEVAAWRESARRAENEGNTDALIRQQLQLASALVQLGDLDGAFDTLLEAVRRARLERDVEPLLHRVVTYRTLACLGPRSARLLDSLATQYRQLPQPGWPHGLFDLLLAQASALLAGGNAARAAECLTQARQLATEHLPDRVWEVDADLSAAAIELGEPRKGAELGLALVNDRRVTAGGWTRGQCLTNAALNLMSVGEFKEALEYLLLGRQAWSAMRHDRAVALTWAIEADLLRRRGDLESARAALAHAGSGPARGYEAGRDDVAARLASDRGELAQAATSAKRAMLTSLRTQADPDAAKSALFAAECLVAARRFTEATEASASAQGLIKRIEEFCRWSPTDDTQMADEHAARALRIIIGGYGGEDTRLRAAREHLQIAASLDPLLGWFRLELAFIDLREGKHRDAIRRLTEAAQLTEDPSLRAAIERLHARLDKPAPA
jgi:tetratricopeptide (TPR) repeat protein